MLDELEVEQKIVYKILKNSIKNNKISHAYLFETNGYANKKKFTLAFAKSLLCAKNYTSSDKCKDCKQCKNIDKNIFSELKIIRPEGLWIKKEQLVDLQKSFSTKSIESKRKVYIIENAERLNLQAENSILKFLEEPEENIIAILVTDNMHQLLDTIISRCQVISFAKNNNFSKDRIELIQNQISMTKEKEEILYFYDNVLEFVKYFEKNKIDTILRTQKKWLNFFKEKNEIIIALEIMIIIYKELINIIINNESDILEIDSEIKNIIDHNDINKLTLKINKIIESIDKVKYNVNNNLLIDKLIMELERCD